jgi:Zn-dependent membrane protease YugP
VLQDADNYGAMRLRQALVGPANFGSTLSYIIIAAGLAFSSLGLVWIGIIAFAAVVLFQLVTLPVEFNASSRARRILVQSGLVTAGEDPHIGRVLNAAALTYVAALITSLLTLAYYLFRVFGASHSDE